MKKSFLIALFFALSTSFAFAQTPTTIPGKITYQGKLLENSLPVTGTKDIVFNISGTGWTETHNNVAIVTGLYSVQLGSITPIPVTVFNGPTVSLEIIVEGTTLSPQVELLSVPYAYRSEEAHNAARIAGDSVSTTAPAIGQTLTWNGTAWVPGDAATKAYVDELMDKLGIIKDVDGNYYKTTVIGNQTWMAENLKTTKYNDGTLIPNVTDATAWSNLVTPAYCWYNNDNTAYGDIYGALYNWYTVNTGNLCPTGWHVPTDAEWKELEMFLGMSQAEADAESFRGTDEGGKLKETGTIHWNSPNTGATNETGFTALPGGYNLTIFGALGDSGYWWSTTEKDITKAWSRNINYGVNYIGRSQDNKRLGYSIRCVKD